mgnify:CR=1 FL=1
MTDLRFELLIKATIDQVWEVLGTVEGLKTFLSPDLNVVYEIGGPFEIFFDTSQPLGMQGSEGMKVIAYEPKKRIGFTWNNPPSLAEIREQQTAVFIELLEVAEGVKVRLNHTGFASDEAWVKSYDYFKYAWGKIVMPRLLYACEVGSYPWREEVDLLLYEDRVLFV